MNTICALGHTVPGIDISRYQDVNGHPFDFNQAKTSGIQFCFIKATEGSNHVDATFLEHFRAAKDAALLRGCYHFFHPRQDPRAQAKLFCDTIGSQSGCLPPVLDWETTDGLPSMSDRQDALIFLQAVEAQTGKVPIIYGSPYFLLTAIQGDPRFAIYPLWVAHYGARCPLVPQPFQNWTFWQTSGTGLDHDVFNGSLQALQVLAF